MKCNCNSGTKWFFIIIAMLIFSIWFLAGKGFLYMQSSKSSVHEIASLFPSSSQELSKRVTSAIQQAEIDLKKLLEIPAQERTFENTVLFFDRLSARFGEAASVAWALQNMSPDEDIRSVASSSLITLQNMSVDLFSNNRDLYRALCDYYTYAGATETLNAEEKKYLTELLEGFEKGGINLPDDQQELVKNLKKEIGELSQEFKLNINNDMRSIAVTYEELAGLNETFIDALAKNDEGKFILGVDYPTYLTVMDNCSVESTRKALWVEFNNRAYPANEKNLKHLIAKRDELAHLLGFESYAHLELDDEMVKTPERVTDFLDQLTDRSCQKLSSEMESLKCDLPEGVTLTQEGQFKRWDLGYVMNQYRKKHLHFDVEKVREYFSVDRTVDQILDIYGTFLSVDFRQKPLAGLWHSDVRYIEAYTKDGNLLGYLLLDLHPRPNKYSHACMADIIHPIKHKDGTRSPAVIIVLANFPKPTPDQPGLLRHDDVKTFFHEFGHAMHGLFGATEMIGFAGTNVKRDFVEMPSQMLEEWLYDADILKKMSSHYKTGEPLDDATIATLRKVKNFGSGYYVQRQAWLARVALNYFLAGADKNPNQIQKNLAHEYFAEYLACDDNDHFEASFGHLTGYGARYYGYLWSKVFALDMFAYVKQQGLLNPQVGQHYIDTVISKGGSVEPDQILLDFLGRQPNMDAFWADCGL